MSPAAARAQAAARLVALLGALRWLPLVLALGGCSSLPFFGKKQADVPAADAAASAPAGVAQYRLDIEAPKPFDELLKAYLDVARFQQAPSSEGITLPELDRLLATTPQQARNLLETEGYFNAEVKAERVAGADGLPLVKITVVPGPRTVVGEVAIETTGPLADAAQGGDAAAARRLAGFREAWPLKPGQPFRQTAWNDAKNLAMAHLRADGYPAAAWTSTAAQVDADANRVKLEGVADSGPLFRLGSIQVEGIERYDAEAVRQLATFSPGTPYSEKTLLDYQERLVKSGLFEGASVEVDPDPAHAASAPVLVKVKELTLQQATVGAGYSANTGPRVTLDHYHRRFLGQRWILHDKLELGPNLKSFGASLTSYPLAGLYRNLVAGSYERLRAADEVRTSWSSRLGRIQDTGRIERSYYLAAQHARVDSATLVTSSDAVSGHYDWVLRAVDDVLLPTRGFTVNAQGGAGLGKGRQTRQLSGQEIDERGPFARAYGRLTWYRPFGDWYASARVEAGQVFARSRIAVPDTLLFRAGGDDSGRGYGYRTLGPVIDGAVASGRVLATVSAEVAHPISPRYPAFLWATFIDAGDAADRWKDLHAVLGYGVGLRWRSPVGPLKLDVAYGQAVRQVRLHLSVGIAF